MSSSGNAETPLGYGPPITLEQARKAMRAAGEEARKNNWPMVVAVVDSGGHLVLLERADNAQYGSIRVAQLKAETAVAFKRPTRALEQALEAGGVNLRLLSIPGATTVDGGFPLIRDGRVVGAIAASGMLPAQDAQVARAGVAALDEN